MSEKKNAVRSITGSIGRIAVATFVAVLWAAMIVDLYYEPIVSALQAKLEQTDQQLREAQDRMGAIQYRQQQLAITCEHRPITTAAYTSGENLGNDHAND
ncbi:MAG: hypothetical protein JWL63_3243 [Rhodocyclales bacterium]|nr:hypothetical protein [Rhodocyclales bacterium]